MGLVFSGRPRRRRHKLQIDASLISAELAYNLALHRALPTRISMSYSEAWLCVRLGYEGERAMHKVA